MTRPNGLIKSLLLVCLAAFPVVAQGATSEFRVLFDVDNNSATGCVVSGMLGVDQVLVTRVTDTETAASVTQTHRQLCVSGLLGAPVDVNASGWPVGWQPTSGHMLVETRAPFSAFGSGGMPPSMRVGFTGTRGAAGFATIVQPNGDPIMVPKPPAGRRHAVGHPGPVRVITLDGQDSDWYGIPPLVPGTAGGGASDLKLIQAFSFADPNASFLYFNFNVNVSGLGILAVNDSYTRLQGVPTFTQPAPGVLGNDVSNDGPLTAVPVGIPDNGSLALNADGSFTYTPTDPNSVSTDTFEYKAVVGDEQSNVARVSIHVEHVDEEPAFTSANSVQLQAGVPANFTVTTSGVPEPTITFTGTLPVGVTFNNNGNGTATIGGTPANGSGGTYLLVLTASNSAGTATQNFTIVVCNTIAVTNPVTSTGTAGAAFSETFTQTGAVGSATFTLDSGVLPAGLTLATNGTLSGTPTVTGSFPITVRVTDSNGCTGVGPTYNLVINCQTITVTNPATTTGTAGTAFSETFTQSGAFGGATFTTASTLPAGLTLATNGTLSGIPTQTGSFPIVVMVTDSNGCTGTGATYTLVIGCQTITVTNPATVTGTAASAFSQTFTQSGAIGGATFTTASTLPTGLTLATNGTLSGTPTQTGTFPIVVTVTDGNGCTGTSATYNLVINCQTVTVTNPATTTATVGTAFSQTFTQTGAIGTATFTTASTLPTGFTLATNGTLSGTTTQFGSFPIVVTVTDSNGCTGTSATYNLVVNCQTITVTNPGVSNGTAGTPFSQTFTETGSLGGATFTTASTLPTGLTLATNGTLSGTPTQTGSFPIVVTVTDGNGCTGTGATYTLVIACQTITVTNPVNTNGTASSPFSETFTQTSAIGGATFTTASTLPTGLSLATNGTLSGTPTQTGSFPIVVTVTDGNGCTGTGATYTLVIACQVITVTNPATTTGTAASPFSETFTQTGAIGTATFTTASTLPAGLALATNGTLSGTPTQTGSFPIVVTVTDSNGCTGTGATYTLVIGCQVINVTNPVNTNGTVSAPFSETFTQTGAIGTATFTTASTLPAGLTLATNGTLSGTPTEDGSFPIVVTVTDSNGCTGTSATYTLVIGCQTITVTNPANANGTVSTPFSETFTQASAVGGATFTTASTLPAGLTLATNGVLSGTPTQSGSFPIVVTVTDGNGCTGTSATYNLVIACQIITVTNPANATGPAGTPFSETFTQAGAIGTATFTTASTLPTGLTLSTAGVLSGTPTQGGTFPIVVTVTDSNGCTGTSATYNLVITCPIITVTNPANAAGTAGSPFSETFTQTGGQGTITFTTSSTLPTGLTLSTAGVLSGTPTQTGSFPIVVTATDQNGCTGTGATYTLVIGCQTITVTNPGVSTGVAAAPFSQTFTQTAAIGGATFTLNSGTLPAGLTLATNGTLSGTPTQTGSFPITVLVTDGNGCTGVSATYTLIITCQTITVTNPATTTGTVNAAFSQTFTQVGAIGSATFTTASTLPAGLSLSTAGVLSGTPSEDGTFPIVVTVTDSNGCTGTSATYNLVIACQTITVTNPANANGTVGTPFSETFTETGALGGATFTTASTLPAGLTLSTAGVLSGTPTQSGSFPIVVTVTDGQNSCTGTSATYNLVIACQVITVTNPGVTTGTVDAAFSQTFTQASAIGTATFTTSSTLPSGLTLSTAGVLSGTPGQPGSFPITVLVTDSNGCTGTSAVYTLVIACQTITVTNPGVTTGTVDALFSQTFTQTGVGTHTPATFTTSSTLPSGLTLATNGTLSGTPGQPGSFPIVVTVTDVNGCTGTGATYTLVIACQTITVTNPGVTTATYNQAFSQTFTQTGVGTHTPANFTTASTLPTGITLSTAGVLAGTPTQTGTFPIVVTVTDANGCTGTSATYTLAVAPVANADTINGGVDNTQLVLTGGTTGTPTTPSVQVAGTIKVNDLPSAATVTVVTGVFATTAGGSVTVAADGTFLYTPPVNSALAAITSDTFTYTVTSNTGGTGPATSAPGTVTINLVGRVWFVKNDAGGGGNGQSHLPFNTLAAAEAASTAGDYVHVYFGDGNTTGQNAGITLKANQTLHGQGLALVVNGSTLVAAGSQPRIGNSGGNGVTILNNVGTTVRGLSISGSINAIDVTTSAAATGTITITNNTIFGAGAEGLDVNLDPGTSGTTTVAITNNAWNAGGTHTGNAIDVDVNAGTLNLDLSTNTSIVSAASAIVIDGSTGSLTITGFANNTISGNTGGSGVSVNVARFDATPLGGFEVVNAGTMTIGASGNGVGANGLTLTTVAGDLSFADLDIFNDNGAGLFASGTVPYNGPGGVGFQIAVGSGATVTSINGPAVSLNTVTANLPFNTINSTNSATTGVSLVTVPGTFSAGAGSAISNATGTDFFISAGTAAVTYNGTITDDVGQLVSISGVTGTSTKAFTGAITDNDNGTGNGISLTGNSANTTMRFSGGITLSTGANPAFTATGGGIVEVCDENPCNNASTGALINKITTTSGTALNVANTNIGFNNLEFRSISAGTGAGSAGNGITLDTTGSSGGLKVAGTGAAGTGGTIQRKTGADASTTAGIGIYLNNTSNVSLKFMQLNDFDNFAIRGTSVNGLTMDNVVTSGTIGTNSGIDEGSVVFGWTSVVDSNPGLTGSVSITNCNFGGGSIEDTFRVRNGSGSLNRITMTNDTFASLNPIGDALKFETGTTGVINATIQNSFFTSAAGDLFNFLVNGTATDDLVFTGNTLTNNNPLIATGGGGVTVSGNGSSGGNLTFNISNNSFRDSDGHAILIVKSTGPASFSGTFDNNDIGVAATANSGSIAGSGIKVQNAGQGTVTIAITNNRIRQFNNFGIELLTGGGATLQSGILNANVTGNTVSNPGTGGLPMNGIHLNGGTVPGDTYAICVNIGGAGALANAITGSGANGGTDVRVRQRQNTTVNLPGYGGANNNDAAVQVYLSGRNGGATALSSNTVGSGGGGFTGAGTGCP